MTPVEKYDVDLPEWWDKWIDIQATQIAQNHEYILGTVAK